MEVVVMRTKLGFAAIAGIVLLAGPSLAAERDWSAVGKALGKEGAIQPGGVYRVALPRTDLHVMLDGVNLKPGFALGSWLAFAPIGDQAMVMGDLVMTEDEINPVMKKLEEEGIAVTALHNHLLRAEPATMYMHVLGHGDPVSLAERLHAALALSKTPLEAAASGATQQAQSLDIDVAAIDRTLGAQGKVNSGVLSYGIPRREKIEEGGMPVTPPLGSAIGINFQPTGGGRAAITGDFVLTAKEVNPVAKALRESGIEVTALHNHMLGEEPRLFFMHFWANDDAQKLAKGLRAALDQVNAVKS
jgi:biotin operon repressor